MTGTYERGNIRFQYPENWRVIDEADPNSVVEVVSVTIESPGGATWSLFERPFVDPEMAVEEALRALSDEYGKLEEFPAEPLWGQTPAGTCREVQFLYIDFIIRAQAHAWRRGQRCLAIVVQAEDNEFEEVELVFRAMAVSLMRELEQVES